MRAAPPKRPVVIAGASRDPVYASGFFTEVLGAVPDYRRGAWVWTLPPVGPTAAPATGASLAQCRAAAAAPAARGQPLTMSQCVWSGAGRA